MRNISRTVLMTRIIQCNKQLLNVLVTVYCFLHGTITTTTIPIMHSWFSSPSSERLCIFCHHGAIYIKKFFLNFFLLLPLPFGELSVVGFALDVVN